MEREWEKASGGEWKEGIFTIGNGPAGHPVGDEWTIFYLKITTREYLNKLLEADMLFLLWHLAAEKTEVQFLPLCNVCHTIFGFLGHDCPY